MKTSINCMNHKASSEHLFRGKPRKIKPPPLLVAPKRDQREGGFKSVYNAFVCRYNEIALKGKNRWRFENSMMDRIVALTKGINELIVEKIQGRILIHHKKYNIFTNDELEKIKNALSYVFGLDSFSLGIKTNPEINQISQIIENTAGNVIQNFKKTSNKETPSFRIRVNRADKNFPMSTKNTEIALADIVFKIEPNLTVDLENADISIFCEIHYNTAFIFFDKINGPGGLPTGTNSSALALLSGGFDSPVASYLTMRRGTYVDFLTFHSHPFTPVATEKKIKNLVAVLNQFQGPRYLFSCNLLEVQKIICTETRESFRTILYRRMMFRLAEKIAKLNGNRALITGESIGQVASQTIINLGNIDNATSMLVLRPLIGMDKRDSIKLAEQIGTFNISKEQVPDSCTIFAPQNPTTGAPLHAILHEEKNLNTEELLDLAYQNTVAINIETNEQIPLDQFFKKE